MVLTATPVKPTQTKTRLTKTALVNAVADRTGQSKAQAKRIVDATLQVIQESLEKEVKVSITGFGTFESRWYKSRNGVNPRTGERITIPKSKRPVFVPGAKLKRAVKGE